jgi:uncharacterized membrane protein
VYLWIAPYDDESIPSIRDVEDFGYSHLIDVPLPQKILVGILYGNRSILFVLWFVCLFLVSLIFKMHMSGSLHKKEKLCLEVDLVCTFTIS